MKTSLDDPFVSIGQHSLRAAGGEGGLEAVWGAAAVRVGEDDGRLRGNDYYSRGGIRQNATSSSRDVANVCACLARDGGYLVVAGEPG